MLKKIILFIFTLVLLVTTGFGGWLYYMIVVEPGEEIRPENIQNILGKESHVFYSDGKTKLGVFFDTAHRQYVTYPEIPPNFVNALVAAEDVRFFSHFGFDIVGISRAMMKNFQAGRVVQGGSTLTQQTAKNLFKRTERSYEAKLVELLYALRLEYHYSKEKIFEFYANQFYVSGNGHGLGVAARYYFNKKSEELTLVECAFIAGSVKRPNYYNPYRKKTEKGAELARSRARVRVKYVLDKMLQAGMINRNIYKSALSSEIAFKNGRVGYPLDYVMEFVREAVSSNEVRDALEKIGVTNIATSGVRVITTVDRGLQAKTLDALRSELSRLDVRLRGFEREVIQEELRGLKYTGDSSLAKGAFLFGTIADIEGEGKELRIKVTLDKKLGEGIIDSAGLEKLVLAWVKYTENRWSETAKGDLETFVKQLAVGDRVWVSVQEIPELHGDSDSVRLFLEKYPELQGGAIVVQEGQIKGMAGGSENRFFNRAIQAKRTMGSAFKPLVYTAAMQLGWNSTDLLQNRRDVFTYQGQAYFPRPDHNSPHEWVSMSWAGVHSENIASVWLLASLCDKLSANEFREVANRVGLAPKKVDGEEEPYRSYRARIRDRFGIQVNRPLLRASAFRLAIKNLETDFLFEGLEEEYAELKKIHYGLGFDRYGKELAAEFSANKHPVKAYIVKEYKLRKTLLKNSFLDLEQLRKNFRTFKYSGLKDWDPFDGEKPQLFVERSSGKFFFLKGSTATENMAVVSQTELDSYLQYLGERERLLFWNDLQLAEGLSVAAFDMVVSQLDHEYKKLQSQLPFDFEVLAEVEDFRIAVGLFYLVQLSKELGINSTLEPVLSFPLGSNVVTLFEATRMYEGLVTGRVTSFRTDAANGEGFDVENNTDVLAILDRIEDADGQVLYTPHADTKDVVDNKSRMMISSILENIVKFGTGRYADRNVKITDKDEDLNISVPLLGKTGTANRYTNASFLGYLPEVGEGGASMELDGGYALGVYVGFDDNRPMRRKSSRIAGSAGALPTWSTMVNAIIEEKGYMMRLDPVDLSFYGLGIKRNDLGQYNLGVDVDRGGVVTEPVAEVSEAARKTPSILTFGKKTQSGRFIPERNFKPYWTVGAEGVQ